MRIVEALPLIAPDLWRRVAARLPPGEWERRIERLDELCRVRPADPATLQILAARRD